jgi:flavodoxin
MRKPIVIYYSKTGNTRQIADTMAHALQTESLPLNVMKAGRKTKAELETEDSLFETAWRRARESALVILGTPTEFRKPHSRVVAFVETLEARRVAVFCTYYGMLGATLIDLEAQLGRKGIPLVGVLRLCVGTEQYRFRRNPDGYVDQITAEHRSKAQEFAHACLHRTESITPRLQGICGRSCEQCSMYQGQHCQGAEMHCWSGNGCEVFACCAIQRSLPGCDKCSTYATCNKIKSISNQFPGCTVPTT